MWQSPNRGRPAPQVRLEIQFIGLVGRVKFWGVSTPRGRNIVSRKSPVGWVDRIGFSNATDRQKLQAFLNRSKRSGFCDSEADDFATLCSTADKQLFNRILNQPEHVLHPLLPPPSASQYNLRHRPHNRLLFNVLPDWLIAILSLECYIVICIDWLYVYFTALCFSYVEVRFDISVIKELIRFDLDEAWWGWSMESSSRCDQWSCQILSN